MAIYVLIFGCVYMKINERKGFILYTRDDSSRTIVNIFIFISLSLHDKTHNRKKNAETQVRRESFSLSLQHRKQRAATTPTVLVES